jgi:hypothetical protein
MIKIPYGQSYFKGLITENYFYQDRTTFISTLEQWYSKYLVFLRPRRFGKSLFISTLHHYYGLEHKEDFEKLFGNLHVGKNPTALANNFLILRFEFSRIDTSTHERTYDGFLMNTLMAASDFYANYEQFFTADQRKFTLAQTSPESVIKSIFSVVKANNVPYKIYLLIDEYDHFANELLSFDIDRFKQNVSRNGFVRKFYESLKTATGDGIIDRLFITGVSPITMDSLTSGFNISDNISVNSVFNELMGFTETEVLEMLHKSSISKDVMPEMMDDLRDWYDGYNFSGKSTKLLYNPDMVLYFLKEYSISSSYPDEMLDVNIMSDYRKIQSIFKIGGAEIEKFELLEELVKKGYADFPLTRLYNMEAPFSNDDFLSLLFYMGLLTVKEIRSSTWRFEIPNYVIRKLFFEYFTAIFLEKTKFAKSHSPIIKSIDDLVNDANPEPFLKIVEYVLAENHSNRDELSYGEKHLQTLIIGLLFPYKAFQIHSEYESKKGYPDIFLEKMPGKLMNYEIVLELKYVKKSKADTVDGIVEASKTQLKSYMHSERFSRKDVKGFYVVFLGGEVYKWGEV